MFSEQPAFPIRAMGTEHWSVATTVFTAAWGSGKPLGAVLLLPDKCRLRKYKIYFAQSKIAVLWFFFVFVLHCKKISSQQNFKTPVFSTNGTS
jgi:hypothetical protein